MKYRKLDAYGDYSFGKSMQDFIIDADAVGQAVKTNLLLLRGEWWEDTTNGLPLFQNIIGQSGTQEHLTATDLLIKTRIIATKGVSNIQDFHSSYENRRYTIERCTVLTNNGQVVTVSGVAF